MNLTFSDIEQAARRLVGVAKRTPVVSCEQLNQQLQAQIYFKCENLQVINAFKIRGAYNAIVQLSSAQKQQGVLAYSSGNHAQGVAYACRLLGIKATIVMPNNAPQIKLAATQQLGANVVCYDPESQTRESVADAILQQQNLTLIKPFDDPQVIAGQGTAALELLQDVSELDCLLVPCGGGGLLSGTAIAANNLQPNCKVLGVEPELANDAYLSFKTGKLQRIDNPDTLADGTRTASLGDITFPLIQRYVADMLTVSEVAIATAVSYSARQMKLVVEPSGALGLAALQQGGYDYGKRIGVIISGGNIDPVLLKKLL